MKYKFVDRFGKKIERFENIPILYCVAAVFFFSIFRLILDLFLEDFGYMIFSLLAHMIAALSVFLILLVIYHFATRERSDKVMGVVAAFLSSILLGPLIDFILIKSFGWTNFKHTYILPHESTRELVIRFFTFFGLGRDLYSGTLDVTSGPSVGLILSIFVLLLLSFLYFYYKNKNVLRSTLFTFAIYFVLFMGSATLVVMGKPIELLGIDHVPTIELRLWYHLLWILLLLVINFYLIKKEYFVGILRKIRPFVLMHYIMMLIFGMGIGHVMEPLSIDQNTFFSIVFALSSVLLAWIFVLFVDELGWASERLRKKKDKNEAELFGSIPLGTAKSLTVVFFLLAIIYSYAGGSKVLFFILLFMGGSFFYSAPPFKLKDIPVLSKLPIVVNSLLLLMLGHSFAGELFDMSTVFPLFFLTIFLLAANFVDIKTYEGDKKEGIKTLPVLLGLKKAKLLIGAFFALAVFSSYFLIEELISLTPTLSTVFILILGSVGVVEFYLINREEYEEGPVFITYLVLLFIFTYILFVL